MYNHKYGEFADMQISEIKEILRKRIFFLLLVAEDLETKEKFPEVNLEQANTTLLWRISGLNELLGNPTELVTVLNFAKYRKLILDAGAEIMKIASPIDVQSAKTAH